MIGWMRNQQRARFALPIFLCSLLYAIAFFGLGWFRGAVVTGYLAPLLCSISGIVYLRRTTRKQPSLVLTLVTLGVAISTLLVLMGIALLFSLVFGTQ